ncbi:hypothetical protein EVAR_13335_1 [Eumeta japonica]|uniref:Uncharacterized protein n=1 Tax=Eumeta variegata TaxID=151549 RepID=A0A4C1TS32_EUMVA|nr:hypothetical protein EVAR_13335_1 [Eumeta japonica]
MPRAPLRDPPQGKSRAIGTPMCCPTASVGFSPTLPAYPNADSVWLRYAFLPPPRCKRGKKKTATVSRATCCAEWRK